jgi:hypothetical protein
MVHFKYRGWKIHDVGGIVIELNALVVNSSNVNVIGWPVTGEPTMIVEYASGTRYAYIGVSRQRAVAAAYSKSVGKYIAERIKPNFEVVKIR